MTTTDADTERPLEERVGPTAFVEVMGHRSHAGRISEVAIAGRLFLRVDPLVRVVGDGPDGEDRFEWENPVFYAASSVFSLCPCDDESMRKMATRRYPTSNPIAELRNPYPIDDIDDTDDGGYEL